MTTSGTFRDAPVHLEQAMPLAEMSVAQIAALPPAQLQEAHTNLLALQAMVKSVLDRMHTALEQRFAQQAQAARLANGRDFGVGLVVADRFRLRPCRLRQFTDLHPASAVDRLLHGAGKRPA